MKFRQFPNEVEAIASNWRGNVLSSTQWSPDGQPGQFGGQASGYKVTSGTVLAFAKPSAIDGENPPVPRAAHEKIAADLAFDLDLPLPPAILHTWTPSAPVGNQPNVAISLWPFLTVHKWQHIEALPQIATQVKLDLARTASVLAVFDTWVDNRDRPNNGNLLVSGDVPGSVQVAYIDYSYSMAYGWRSGFDNVTPCPMYPTDTNDADHAAMRFVLDKIEATSDAIIESVVKRIPEVFLSTADKDLIVAGLVARKLKVRPALQSVYGASL